MSRCKIGSRALLRDSSSSATRRRHWHVGVRCAAWLVVLMLCSSGRADLVAHYPLDDAPGTIGPDSVADVIGGFNGTPTDPGVPTFGIAGANPATGTALDVVGTSIDVAYSPNLNPDNFTLTAWAKPTVADGAPYSVVTNREDLGPGVETGGFVLYNINSRWEFWTGVGLTADAGGAWDVLQGPDVFVDEWQHLAITYDADEEVKSLYIDGELWMEDVGLYSLNQSRDLHIGGGGDFGTQYRFGGTIDDVGLWGVVLDEPAIAQIMTDGAASFPVDQIANWKLDDPAGTTGPDSVLDSVAGEHPGSTAPPNYAFGVEGATTKTGTSWRTTGVSSIDVPYEEPLNPEESFTVTVWARPETAANGHQSVITSRDDAPALNGYVLYSAPSGTWQFWTGAGGWDVLDGPPVEPEVWTHLAISYDADSNEKVLWVNGEPTSDDGLGAGYFANLVEGLHIGGGGDLGTQYRFDGSIDDVGIFDEALTQDQIASIMVNGVQAYLGIPGDYNGNGVLDAEDLDLQASVGIATQDLTYDLNQDGVVDFEGDRIEWLHTLKEVYVGDANLDGLFDSGDFVEVFTAGKYETGQAALWNEGDWNGDLLFDTSDFVAAFTDGGYETGPYGGEVMAVPEPATWILALLASLACLGYRRGTRVA